MYPAQQKTSRKTRTKNLFQMIDWPLSKDAYPRIKRSIKKKGGWKTNAAGRQVLYASPRSSVSQWRRLWVWKQRLKIRWIELDAIVGKMSWNQESLLRKILRTALVDKHSLGLICSNGTRKNYLHNFESIKLYSL